ncbi:hypothetical protein B0J14DRAFT_90110 [Halenospora varia]|nr:hypothetical protein B0J14DRAFT_90110 [Halenospora varia]
MRIHLTSLMAGLLLQDVTNQGLAAASTADSIAWGIGTVMLGVPTNINATVQVSSHKSDIAPIQILLGQIVTHPGGASTYNYVAKINSKESSAGDLSCRWHVL